MKQLLILTGLVFTLVACGEAPTETKPTQVHQPVQLEVNFEPTPTPTPIPNPTPIPQKSLHFSEIISMRTFDATSTECSRLRDTLGVPYRIPTPQELLNYLPTIKDKLSPDYYDFGFWSSQMNPNNTFILISMNKAWISQVPWDSAFGICVYESN